MSIKVVVTDLETGDTNEATVQDGDHILITVDPCYLANQQMYANGTTVLTIRGRTVPLPRLRSNS